MNAISETAARKQWESLTASEHDLLAQVLRALHELRYGSIVLTVHDSRVVEIQRTEKIRSAPRGA